jgi:hypothetical protein
MYRYAFFDFYIWDEGIFWYLTNNYLVYYT